MTHLVIGWYDQHNKTAKYFDAPEERPVLCVGDLVDKGGIVARYVHNENGWGFVTVLDTRGAMDDLATKCPHAYNAMRGASND